VIVIREGDSWFSLFTIHPVRKPCHLWRGL
jgi:hypothetical protein